MSQVSKRAFAYAPLRQVNSHDLKKRFEAVPVDWHAQLDERALKIIDVLTILGFASAGFILTWLSNESAPFRWWLMTGTFNPAVLTACRIGLVCMVGLLSFAGLVAANRFHLLDLPRDNWGLMALKIISVSVLGWGTLIFYQDMTVGVLPMLAMCTMGLIILFRLELPEALTLAAYLIICGIPLMMTRMII